MQQPTAKQTEMQTTVNQLDDLRDQVPGQVPLNQPIVTAPVSGQPSMVTSVPGQPIVRALAPGHPIMYQMAPGQPQPVFFPAVPGQPNMSPQCQGGQHYVSGGGQPVQQVQMAQPVRGQWFPGHPPHRDPDMSPIQFNNVYMKSPLGATRIVEFVSTVIHFSSEFRATLKTAFSYLLYPRIAT